MQIAERRVTRAEIVNGDPRPSRLERLQHRQIVLGMIHQGAFGQLQLQASGIEAAFRQGLPHHISQTRLPELPARQIDRNPQPGKAAMVQLADLADRGAQHPFAHRQH